MYFKDYAMDNYCRAHNAYHSNKSCREFINMYNSIFSPPTKDKEEDAEKEEEDDSHVETINLHWNFYLELVYEEDVIEEICTNGYNT